MPNRIDHIAIGASSLADGTAYLQSKIGVDVPAGGKHDLMGTHNCLMGLGDGCYFELISTITRHLRQTGHAGSHWMSSTLQTG